jgi:D-psicose/D-tagatose/L-ribulose 3-epimerase
MVKFGASILTWIPSWTTESGKYAIQQAAKTGYDVLEILLPSLDTFDAKEAKKMAREHHIETRCSLILPKDHHLPFYPQKAKTLLTNALNVVEEMEGDLLTGVLYTGIGVFSAQTRTPEETQTIVDIIGEVAEIAESKGISLALEPINRYETYLLTSIHEVLEIIQLIGKENVGVHLDTFHANIEESNFSDPILEAGKHLKHIHLAASDRGILGKDNIDWLTLFTSLASINYSGDLVLESFSSEVKELVVPTSLWRKSSYSCEELAVQSLDFMKEMVLKVGL